MTKSSAARVQKHRESLRASGLRLIQIWVPNTHQKGFKKECVHQSRLLQNSPHEKEVLDWIESEFDEDGWK